jgi:hypothetical protein
MAKTIGQLTQATTIGGADELVIEQSGLTKRVAASVVRGGLVNADIDAAAAIAGSKLADGGIVTAKIADANVTPAKLSQPLTLATAQATTSGTSIDFTSIPSWVKRITVMLNGVSTNGTSQTQIQVGAGSFVTSGYIGAAAVLVNGNTVGATTNSTGLKTDGYGAAVDTRYGTYFLTNISGNTWMFMGNGNTLGNDNVAVVAGQISLAGSLDRVRLTTVNGTDTFDAGSVNIMYEG